MRLVFAVFQLPFWVFLAAAAGLFYLGELSYRDTLAKNQEMAQALAGPPPETVEIKDFSRSAHAGLADEVSVLAVINTDYSYELTKTRKGRKKTRYLYVLFDAADPQNAKVARGALVLTEAEKDKFLNDYYMQNAEIVFAGDEVVSVVTLHGQAKRSPDLSSMVNDAFEEQGLQKSDEFIYVEPFLEGRAAGLTPTMSAHEMRNIIRGVALFATMIGLIKFARRRKLGAAAPEEAPDAPAMASPFAAQAQPVPEVTRDAQFEPAVETTDEDETDQEVAKPKRALPIKALALIALAGVVLYTGLFVLLLVGAFLLLQFVAIKKTRTVITGALQHLGVKLPEREETAETLPEPIKAEPEVASKPRRRLPSLSVSMPSFRKKEAKEAETAVAPTETATARKSTEPDIETADVGDAAEVDKLGLGERIQLHLAHLMPASREPKVFADRPDPFDRLASQVQRGAQR